MEGASRHPAPIQPGDLDLVQLERLTIRRYLLSMVFQGVWWAGFILIPFVLAKSLQAPGWMVTLSVTMETTGMLLALYWGQLMVKGGRRRGLFWSGVGGRCIMLLTPLIQGPGQFLVLLTAVYLYVSLVYPAQNGILQANLRPERRGWVFGWGALVQNLTAAATGLLIGHILNTNPDNFRWVYPVVGVVGFGYPLILARLPRPEGDQTHDPADFYTVPHVPLGPVRISRLAGALVTPFREAVETFKIDPMFRWFEANFMVYGIAYMMLIPVVPLFFIEELNLSYKEISSARVLIVSLGVGLLGPVMGRLMDRIHPVRLTTMAFVVLAIYPIVLALGTVLFPDNTAAGAYLAFGVYALGMAGIYVTWNVGSIAFAPPGQGGYYQGIHVAMVGIRGVIGPAIGFTVLKLLGYREVFVLAALIFLTAAISSAALGRKLDRA